MRARDGVAIQECKELAESIKEGPVREQTDTLVGVDQVTVGAAAVGGGRGGGGRRGGWFE